MSGKKEIRIILIGKTGSGKSFTGNAILKSLGRNNNLFGSGPNIASLTAECTLISAEKDKDCIVKVIDTPGLFDTGRDHMDIRKEVRKSLVYSSPGPQAFLLNIPFMTMKSSDENVGERYQEIFGKEMVNYTIVVFNRMESDEKPDKTDFINNKLPKKIREFVKACNNRCEFLINDKEGGELLGSIENMKGQEFFRSELSYEIDRVLGHFKETK